MKTKRSALAPRAPRFDRFQTAVGGLGFVPSAMGARFDPYTEPARAPQRTTVEMEQVTKIIIGGNAAEG
ncbi:MAG: hypothetical protein ACRD1Y_00680 [Terriglobales bacterium]